MEKHTMEALLSSYRRSCFNFNAGPAVLPTEVLEKMQSELIDFNGTGMSVMELSHRSKDFVAVLENAKSKVKSLLNVPDDYEILFVPGGARTQFSMIPMNLYQEGKPINMIHTGSWTKQAIAEGKKVGELHIAGSSEDEKFMYIPDSDSLNILEEGSYTYLCANNTIMGTQWKTFPQVGEQPLVADMTSEIMSRRLNVSDFGLLYGSAQKNLGIAGITMVIIRKDLAERAPDNLPTMLLYRDHIKANSLLNTAPTFPIYVSGLVLDWIEEQGGLEVIEKRNEEKAALLYDLIDSTEFYRCPVHEDSRSVMNVVFRIQDGNEDLEKKLISEAEAAGLKGLKGHRSVGGLRASIYNAQRKEGVEALVSFMKEFEKTNG